MAYLMFDANKVDPQLGYGYIPAGKYLAAITASDMSPTKDATGSYLELWFQILDDPFKGWKIKTRLHLDNPNDLTVKIAKAELSAICRAVGVMTPQDSVELHNLPLQIIVKQRQQDNGEIINEIKGYGKNAD